ncbi:MAG TPA: hypothetical protein VJ044_06150 [Candidatus Hodarchaeales archaeon]|nr:hypothetical protein [Candidatus Hodarchaeales archaeon]
MTNVEVIRPGVDISARVRRTTNQSIPTNVSTAITFDVARWDTGGFFVLGSPTRLTVNQSGKYWVFGSVAWDQNATGLRDIFFQVNGSTVIVANAEQAVTAALFGNVQQAGALWDFVVGDYVELFVLQTAGVAINVTTQNAWSPEFMVQKVDFGG